MVFRWTYPLIKLTRLLESLSVRFGRMRKKIQEYALTNQIKILISYF